MNRTRLVPVLRRGVVLALALVALLVGAASVRIAADWRAAEAILDVATVSAAEIHGELGTQWDRTADIEARLARLADDLGGLEDAVAAADQAVEGDSGDADRLAGQLDEARRRLRDMQDQLRAANDRLDALRRAAGRQVEINAGSSWSDDDHEDDHEEEDDD